MNKEEIALIIAQNGLLTAATIMTAKATKLRKKASSSAGDTAAKLNKDATKAEKLATALRIANDGIIQYQVETSE